MYRIGVDIGGTNFKIGLFKNKKLVEKYSIPTNISDVIEQLKDEIDKLLQKYTIEKSEIETIGVGYPGLVSKGFILSGANLNIFNCNLEKILKDCYSCEVYIKNDVDMAMLTEMNLGNGINTDNVVMLTIGTGVGGSIVINGKLYEGNGAGEFGHMNFIPNGKKCNCGRYGCAEKYLSAISLIERGKEKIYDSNSTLNNIQDLNVSDIEKEYLKGDSVAIEIVEEYAENFSEYLLDICNLLRPDKILIGGGLSFAPQIICKIAQLCKNKGFGYPNAPATDISIAKFGNDAGIYGVLFVN